DVDPAETEGVQHVHRVEDEVLHRLDRVKPLGVAEPRMDRQKHTVARGEEVVHRHPPEGAGAVEIKKRSARAALEQLHVAATDGERALGARRGYGVFHRVDALDMGRPTGDLLSWLSVALTISQRAKRLVVERPGRRRHRRARLYCARVARSRLAS